MAIKRRAINTGRLTQVAKQRRVLYVRCIVRVDEAIASGFYIEATAIIEGMISDRLESRLAFIHHQHPQRRKFSTVGRLARSLREQESETPDAVVVYEKIEEWARLRNQAMHELVKLAEDESADWDKRYQEARNAAVAGKKLFREVDKLVTGLNKVTLDPS